jgi:prepilin-type N-terminal cleavage/methylation domain-containing protein
VRERGFSLIEVLVAAAIVAIVTLAAWSLSTASHPFASESAVFQFDTAMAYARSVASTSGNGATIIVTSGSIAVYSGRPTSENAMRPAPMAPIVVKGVRVSEASLGAPPFALFLNSAGQVTMASFTGATPAPLAAEPPCSVSSRWVLTFTDARSTAARVFPCGPRP